MTKYELPYEPAISLLNIYPREIKTFIYTKKTHMNIYSNLFMIVQTWKKKNRYSPANERINKIWYNNTMKYHSETEKNEIHVTTWMNLENIILSEIS